MKIVGYLAPIGGKNLRLLRSFGRKAGKWFNEMTKTFAQKLIETYCFGWRYFCYDVRWNQ